MSKILEFAATLAFLLASTLCLLAHGAWQTEDDRWLWIAMAATTGAIVTGGVWVFG